MSMPQEHAGSRGQEKLRAFHLAAGDIQEETDLAIHDLLGIVTAHDQDYTVDCMFSRSFDLDDFGTVLGTLLGTHAVQHGWTPEQISGFLLRIVADRGEARRDVRVKEEPEA